MEDWLFASCSGELIGGHLIIDSVFGRMPDIDDMSISELKNWFSDTINLSNGAAESFYDPKTSEFKIIFD